jgi:hypothetical protein
LSLPNNPFFPDLATTSFAVSLRSREIGGEKGCGKDGGYVTLENASRFPLSHSHGGDAPSTSDALSNADALV